MADHDATAADAPSVDEASAVPFVTAAELRDLELALTNDPLHLLGRICQLDERIRQLATALETLRGERDDLAAHLARVPHLWFAVLPRPS